MALHGHHKGKKRTLNHQGETMKEGNDIAEYFKDHKEAQRERRAKRLPIRTNEILGLREKGFKVEQKSEYHFRINGVLDIWPTHNRWHYLKENSRGGYPHVNALIDRFTKKGVFNK